MRYCKNCQSTLGIDCGDAEPDYNKDFCSKGCYKIAKYKMRKKLIEMPEVVFKALEQSAKQNDRSVNKEINNLLKKALKVK